VRSHSTAARVSLLGACANALAASSAVWDEPVAMFSFFRRLQRKELLAAEFPAEYRELLVENVPLYRALSEDEREKLEGLVKILLAEKRFAGVGGLELSEEMCVAIAA